MGQSGPVSNGDEEVLHILRTSRTEASPSYDLVSYSRHLWGCLTYSTAPADFLRGIEKRSPNTKKTFKTDPDIQLKGTNIYLGIRGSWYMLIGSSKL